MHHRMSDSKVDLQLPFETRIAEMINEPLPSDGEHELDSVPSDSSPKEFCDSHQESDACEDMPPPLPFYKRDFQFTRPAQLEGTYSESVRLTAENVGGLTVSQRFPQCMSHVNGSRPRHNRMVGLLPEFYTLSTDRQLLQSRVDEFDTLLADL